MRVARFSRFALPVVIAVVLAACAPTEAATPTDDVTATPTIIPTATSTPTPRPTNTPLPTVTPAITSTPIPTRGAEQIEETPPLPTPLPTEERTYNLCVGIASDSNGFGHVTFQRPDTGQIGITYITPLADPLRAHLDDLGLGYLEISDQSLSASGLTTATSNYLESDQYFRLKRAACQFTVFTPFMPDIALNLSDPEDYIANLELIIQEMERFVPGGTFIVMDFYMPDRADFTVDNNGFGLTEERIAAFNAALDETCGPEGRLGQSEQVLCVETQPIFAGMESPYVLGTTDRADFEAALHRSTTFTPMLVEYFEENPDGALIGDGIHLSLAGRDRMAIYIAELIYDLIAEGA